MCFPCGTGLISQQAVHLSMHLSDIIHKSQTAASIKSSLCWVSHHANILLLLPLCSTSWSLKRETMSYDNTSSSTRGGMSPLMSAHPLHSREDAHSPEGATLSKGVGWNATQVNLADPSGLLLHRFTKTGWEGLSVRSGPRRFIQHQTRSCCCELMETLLRSGCTSVVAVIEGSVQSISRTHQINASAQPRGALESLGNNISSTEPAAGVRSEQMTQFAT